MENSNALMKISFKSEEDMQHCYETNGANVNVNVEPRSIKTRGSSMVKLKSIVGYKWKLKNYPGRLIALHKEGKVVAYSISVEGRGMIRIILIENNKRTLIKGLNNVFLDLQFAESSKEIILAAIDESTLFVYKLEISESNDITLQKLLQINNRLDGHLPICDKINWCPYIPEDENVVDEFSPLLLVWVRGNRFECYSIKSVIENYQSDAENLEASQVTEGVVKSSEDGRGLITNACFSPDGTTLAISTIDGIIKFYQIYFHEPVPRCLHMWNPNNSKKISSFFFLDNLTQTSGSSFWKYLVVLFEDNTEIGVYKCETWDQLQKITFKSTIGEAIEFKAEIDRTSSYLILSDMTNRQMYVLQILKENALSHQQNGDKQQNGNDSAVKNISRVYVKSIAEFNLASSILSYVITNASVNSMKCPYSDNMFNDDVEEYDEESNSVFCVALKLFLIIPEGVQECHILYQPALGESVEALPESPIIAEVKNEIPQQPAKTQINLMTPEAFSSPVVEKPKDVAPDVFSTIFMLAKTPGAANKSHENVINLTSTMIENEKIFQQKATNEGIVLMKSCGASGGSSPSREVRDILLQADSVNEDYYPGEDSDEMEIEAEQSKEVLNALNSIDVDFKTMNIDEDDDEDEENDEVSTEDDDVDGKAKTKTQEWPQAPQFIDAAGGHATSKEVETLSKRMNQMIEIMETQSRYIAELRGDIYKVMGGVNVNNENIRKVEENCKRSVDDSKNKIEQHLLIHEMKQREMSENMMKMFQTVMRSQATITENAVRENLMKITTNKAFTDNMSKMILSGIQKTIEITFRKSLEEMIPSYEKISHEMLREVGKTFSLGTKEYMRGFEAHVKQYGIVQSNMNEVANAIGEIPSKTDENIKTSVLPVFNRLHFDIKQQIGKTEEKILREMKDLVKSEIQKGFERQAVNLEESVLSVVQRSHTETPAPTIFDHKEQIKQLLARGDINNAFHQTLVSSDLSLLEYTIEKADINMVFDPCPLDQSVLLSLIQQLTADMSKISTLKVKYLTNAVISLNKSDPIIKEHSPKILNELVVTLDTFRNANPSNAYDTNLKIVSFLAKALPMSEGY